MTLIAAAKASSDLNITIGHGDAYVLSDG